MRFYASCDGVIHPIASVSFESISDGMRLLFKGRLDADGAGVVWAEAVAASDVPGRLEVDLSGVDYVDGAGIGLLLDLKRRAGERFVVRGMRPEFEQLLKPFENEPIPTSIEPPNRKESFLVYLGRLSANLAVDLRDQISFLGQLLVLFGTALLRPSIVRWNDVWVNFQKVGNDALLIVGLIGFLMGLIMAFQASIPLAQFGVQIFIVNLVGLAMLRELGAIMTAIVVAGRSGSAFAAEIGTMKVNEEINALITMGLDPTRFLVLPRVIAGTLAAPVLTVYANLIGIFGGLLVVNLIGYSWSAIWTQFVSAMSVSDLMTGMIKSVVFGFLVSMVGCLRGLQTKKGALAVGESTTRSVVTSIILIILTDGIFAVVFYAIGF
jgi:phospholipid/cholesterol/gamma-HCH transport system permease protein